MAVKHTTPIEFTPQQIKNFHSHVDKKDIDKCWTWNARRDKRGYGEVKIQGIQRRASRVAYEIFYKQSPGALLVLHKCDNPPCCNPHHLFLGTDADNTRDKISKGRDKDTPVRGESNYFSKLNNDRVREIRHLRATTKLSWEAIGKMFGVCASTACRAAGYAKVKSWRHIK